jgi:hypothetical protein
VQGVKVLSTPMPGDDSVVHLPGYTIDPDAGKPQILVTPIPDGADDMSILTAVIPYEVGTYRELKGRSDPNDGLEVHHAPQKHAAGQAIPGYQEKTGPSIVLPKNEHVEIPNLRGNYAGTARDLLARDMRNLREFTSAPNQAIQELVELAKQQNPDAYQKKGAQ